MPQAGLPTSRPLPPTLPCMVGPQWHATKCGKYRRNDRIIFKEIPARGHPSITIGDRELERINCAKVLGVMSSSDLSWQSHVDYLHPNDSRHLYFLSMLKRVGASPKELIIFYKATVRSATEYACVVWHTGLTGERSDWIESVQQRALNITEPHLAYEQALASVGLEMLHARSERQAQVFYLKMQDP